MEAQKRSRPSILKARKRSRPSILTKNGANVPNDIIIDILSRLPVKSVVRFKCVCKSWLMITHQKFFIDKHLSRSQIIYQYKDIYDKKYAYNNSLHGLVLETDCVTGLYRIRNPATKQVFQMTPQVCQRGLSYSMGFDPSSNMYKLVNFYKKEGTKYIGARMLTIGSDDDYAWRDLDVNVLSDYSKKCSIYHKGVRYRVSYDFFYLQKADILRLSMDGKSSTIKVPQDFKMVPGYHLSRGIQMFILGDEKLSIGFMIRHILHVWVLENYEKSIWSEKRIISVEFLKDSKHIIKVQSSPNLSKLHLTIENRLMEYDVESKTYICLAEVPQGKSFLYKLTPSLVSLKGMCLESDDP